MKGLTEQAGLEWVISTQVGGEASIVTLREGGLFFAVLGKLGSSTPDEVREWLHDLAAVAREAPASTPASDYLPILLHQAVTALLFSHGEIWGFSLLSLVLCDEEGSLGVGWVGDARVAMDGEEGAAEPAWVRVVDASGREGRAWRMPAQQSVRLEFVWPAEGPDPESAASSVRDWAALIAKWHTADGVAEAQPGERSIQPGSETAEETSMDTISGRSRPSWSPGLDDEAEALEPQGVVETLGIGSMGREPAWLEEHPAPPLEAGEIERASEEIGPLALERPEETPRALEGVEGSSTGEEGTDPLAALRKRLDVSSETPQAVLSGSFTSPPGPRSSWPTPEELKKSSSLNRRTLWISIGAVLALALLLLWLLAGPRGKSQRASEGLQPLETLLFAVGLAPNRFDLYVESQPPGASIAVDGHPLPQVTPATIKLRPGARQVRLSFPDRGGATYALSGRKGQSLRLDAALWGGLAVISPESEAMISVSLDGEPQGNLPVLVEHVAPGPHQLTFTGPGLDPWTRTIDIRVGQTQEVLATPMPSPGTGILHVRSDAGLAEEETAKGNDPVYVDGELRGRTPLTLEVARGPHSVRVMHAGEEAPVQVVDLPGGQERFLTFEFGAGAPSARLHHEPPPRLPSGQPLVVSAVVTGDPAPRVREMWLNVRTPGGSYRRYEMMLIAAPGGTAGATVFPLAMADPDGMARYYVSAQTTDGDEYFSEIVRLPVERAARGRRSSPASR